MSKRLEGGYLGARPTWSLAANPGIWAVEQVYARRVAGTWPVGAGSFDEFYEYVTLLLHMDGSNGSTQFIDSSLRNLSITAVNSTISTSQSKFGGASGSFVRSSGGRLNVPTSNNEFIFGAGDFTIEAWVYLNSLPGTSYPGSFWITGWGAANSDAGCEFYLTTTNIVFNLTAFSSPTAQGAHGMATGQWYHIAATRSGSTVKVFVNGQEKGTGASTVDAATPSFGNAIAISAGEPTGGSTGGNFDGYIDELRITKGYCRYASSFSVPTGSFENEGATLADPFYNYVSLLLPMNGSNNSTTFTDKSPSAKTVTPSGDAKLLTATKRYGVSSAYFDGTGDGIWTTDVALGTGDFTIEMWINTTSTTQYAQLIGNESPGFTLLINNGTSTDGKIAFYNGTLVAVTSTGSYNDGKWHHIAVTRTGTALTIWVDGTSGATATNSASHSGSGNLWIGRNNAFAGRDLIGYIDDLRITKGVARYVANFIPPLPHADYGTLVDPYLGSTSLLMPMEGPNNSTGFFDRADRLPVTTYGNAKISNAQYKWGLTSAYFDGAGDYLIIPAGTQFAYGSGDFTIELWLYKAASGSMAILDSTGVGGFGFLVNDTQVQSYVTNGAAFTVTYSIPLNTWTHIAYSRSGTTLKLFVNGSQIGSNTDSNSYTSPADLNIGRNPGSNTAFLNGYIDDLRIVKGFARYTTNFTPPTAAFNSDSTSDPYLSNVSLLLKMDGANNSTTFADSSLTPKAVFANGDAKISTTQSKFGGTSAYLDGNGDHLSIPNSNDFEFGSGDFTIEFWAYVTALKGYQAFIAKSYAAADQNGWGLICEGSNVITFYAGNGSWTLSLSAGVTPTINTWQHYALTRSGTTWRLFIDGQVKASTTNSLTPTAGTLPLYIGRYPYFPGFNSAQDLSGYIDDLRITKGVARYTANFLPPTISHPAWSQTDASFSSVSLLLNGNGANASTVIADRSTNGLTAVPNGNAQISTTQSRFGGSSLYFDGTGDYLLVDSATARLTTGDHTVEMWIYPTAYGGVDGGYPWSQYYASGSPAGRGSLGYSSTGTIFAGIGSTSVVSTQTYALNTWHHVALTRSGSTNYLFVNGALVGTFTNSEAVLDTTVQIGTGNSGSAGAPNYGRFFTGYIDDLRITKGVARYTAAFTPPVAPYPIPVTDANFGAVSLLLHMNGANASTYFPDHSYNALTVTANGNAQISTAQSKFGGASAYFDGSGDYLTVPSTAASGFGTGDFTIEAWIRPAAPIGGGSNNDRCIFGSMASTPNSIFFLTNGDNTPAHWDGTTQRNAASVLTTDVWSHVAWVRSSGVLTIYINGVGGTGYSMTTNLPTDTMYIGGTPSASRFMNGYIDSLRITKGIARYTAAFTPPTAQFPNS